MGVHLLEGSKVGLEGAKPNWNGNDLVEGRSAVLECGGALPKDVEREGGHSHLYTVGQIVLWAHQCLFVVGGPMLPVVGASILLVVGSIALFIVRGVVVLVDTLVAIGRGHKNAGYRYCARYDYGLKG